MNPGLRSFSYHLGLSCRRCLGSGNGEWTSYPCLDCCGTGLAAIPLTEFEQ